MLKKLVMFFFGPPVKYVVSQLNLHAQVNQQIKIIEGMVQDIYPSAWVINSRSQAEISKIKKVFNLPENLDMTISKNDLMFKNYIVAGFSTPDTFKAYLVRTVHFMDIIEKIAERKWGKNQIAQSTPFLDFASGYGAFERLLIHRLPAEEIYTSDIKTQGVDFQVEQFGVKGIYSSFTPEDFKPAKKFKFIYVASLFSHLPEDLFKRWLKVLWELTDDDGVFVFSIHSTKIIGEDIDFKYLDSSEDSNLVGSSIEDSITQTDKYGTAYISDSQMEKHLLELGIKKQNYYQYPKVFCGLQDIVVVSKKENIFDDTLKFGYFDSTQY